MFISHYALCHVNCKSEDVLDHRIFWTVIILPIAFLKITLRSFLPDGLRMNFLAAYIFRQAFEKRTNKGHSVHSQSASALIEKVEVDKTVHFAVIVGPRYTETTLYHMIWYDMISHLIKPVIPQRSCLLFSYEHFQSPSNLVTFTLSRSQNLMMFGRLLEVSWTVCGEAFGYLIDCLLLYASN